MNVVDRIFIVFIFSIILLLLTVEVNILEFFTLEVYFVLIVAFMIMWVLLSFSCEKIKEMVFKNTGGCGVSREVVKEVVKEPVDILPIVKTAVENQKLRDFKSKHVDESIDKLDSKRGF